MSLPDYEYVLHCNDLVDDMRYAALESMVIFHLGSIFLRRIWMCPVGCFLRQVPARSFLLLTRVPRCTGFALQILNILELAA